MYPQIVNMAAVAAALWTCQVSSASIQHHSSLSMRQDTGGTLSYNSTSEPFTFHYTTSEPKEDNYIGLWAASGGGPTDGLPSLLGKASLRWEYAPGADGVLHLRPEHLERGEYTAFFLVELYSPEEAVQYLAEPGESYTASVDGLLLGRGSAGTVTFEKVDGEKWIQVAPDGGISGTPRKGCLRGSEAVIRATADNGSAATIRVTIPVRQSKQPLVEDLAVMTYNLWAGGAPVRNYHEKQLRFILSSGADVIGLQEAGDASAQFVGGESHVGRLANALGWYSWSGNFSIGIISRYPIVEEHGQVEDYSGRVRINLNGDSEDVRNVNFWDTHTYPLPFGPETFCFENATVDEVLADDMEVRGNHIADVLKRMAEQLASSAETPVLLVGDMNAPSHLDWIEALQGEHCGIGEFVWPTSLLPLEAGLIDSFRVANPDVVAERGLTWSPVHKVNEPAGQNQPQDRIDFVYATKELEVISSEMLVVGEPRPIPNERDNEWTSDHAAVLTHFRLP